MSTKQAQPLHLRVMGFDDRAVNMFRLFLKGPCHNKAVIVEADQGADAFLIDVDSQQGVASLTEQRKNHPDSAFIVLSMKRYAAAEGLIFVQKPARTREMLEAIEQVHQLVAARRQVEQSASPTDPDRAMKVIRVADRSGQAATHRVAMMMDEQSFGSYLGHMDDVDPKARWQWRGLFIDPNHYLQTHIEHAVRQALEHGRPTRVETRWKPVYVFPEQRLIAVNAEEAQIRSACGIPFERIAIADASDPESGAELKVTELEESQALEILKEGKAVPIEAFLWKMALWTSKGRLPAGTDPHQPVFLRRWPNFTRILLTPHAMRIAAMLWQRPASLFDVAAALEIRQQFVFAFFYAAQALHLTDTGEAAPVEAAAAPAVPAEEKAERASLFGKLLKRLRLS